MSLFLSLSLRRNVPVAIVEIDVIVRNPTTRPFLLLRLYCLLSLLMNYYHSDSESDSGFDFVMGVIVEEHE